MCPGPFEDIVVSLTPRDFTSKFCLSQLCGFGDEMLKYEQSSENYILIWLIVYTNCYCNWLKEFEKYNVTAISYLKDQVNKLDFVLK